MVVRAVTKTSILLSHERSGSHLAGEFLGAHANVRMIDEVCNPGAVRPSKHRESFYRFKYDYTLNDPKFMLEPTRERHGAFVAAYFEHLHEIRAQHDIVIDIKYGHVQNFEMWWCPVLERPFLFGFCIDHDVGIIHLFRKNVVAATVSSLIADQRGIWHSWQVKSDTDHERKFTLPVREVVRKAKMLQRQTRLYRDWTGNCRKIEIAYEDIALRLGRGGEIDEKLGEFLGSKLKEPFKPKHEKLTRPMREIVENFDELKAACEAEGLGWCMA
jgi:hypothetical protein